VGPFSALTLLFDFFQPSWRRLFVKQDYRIQTVLMFTNSRIP
jgi:hypothetical protein